MAASVKKKPTHKGQGNTGAKIQIILPHVQQNPKQMFQTEAISVDRTQQGLLK